MTGAYGGHDSPWTATIGAHVCTVMAPPIKAGDVVTEANIGQLPDESLIAIDRCPAIMRGHGWLSRLGYWKVESGELDDEELIATGKTFRVLRIGGAS